MNNEYHNLVLPTNEEEEYCAEMVASTPSFREVLFGGYDLAHEAEAIVELWLALIEREYTDEELVFPQDPQIATDYLRQIGDSIYMDGYLETAASGVDPANIP